MLILIIAAGCIFRRLARRRGGSGFVARLPRSNEDWVWY
jgi:hypothetical protein